MTRSEFEPHDALTFAHLNRFKARADHNDPEIPAFASREQLT